MFEKIKKYIYKTKMNWRIHRKVEIIRRLEDKINDVDGEIMFRVKNFIDIGENIFVRYFWDYSFQIYMNSSNSDGEFSNASIELFNYHGLTKSYYGKLVIKNLDSTIDDLKRRLREKEDMLQTIRHKTETELDALLTEVEKFSIK